MLTQEEHVGDDEPVRLSNGLLGAFGSGFCDWWAHHLLPMVDLQDKEAPREFSHHRALGYSLTNNWTLHTRPVLTIYLQQYGFFQTE